MSSDITKKVSRMQKLPELSTDERVSRNAFLLKSDKHRSFAGHMSAVPCFVMLQRVGLGWIAGIYVGRMRVANVRGSLRALRLVAPAVSDLARASSSAHDFRLQLPAIISAIKIEVHRRC